MTLNGSVGSQSGTLLSSTPTSTNLSFNSAGFWSYGDSIVAYLFATKAGISKVGSYTGNGTSQTINCGFAAGARFILIKRTDAAGDWFVWDSVRGITSSYDPFLRLNTTDAEVTYYNVIIPNSTGFGVQTDPEGQGNPVNTNFASYIYLAIN